MSSDGLGVYRRLANDITHSGVRLVLRTSAPLSVGAHAPIRGVMLITKSETEKKHEITRA